MRLPLIALAALLPATLAAQPRLPNTGYELARRLHPDTNSAIPGADAAMAELNAARDAALEELRQ